MCACFRLLCCGHRRRSLRASRPGGGLPGLVEHAVVPVCVGHLVVKHVVPAGAAGSRGQEAQEQMIRCGNSKHGCDAIPKPPPPPHRDCPTALPTAPLPPKPAPLHTFQQADPFTRQRTRCGRGAR